MLEIKEISEFDKYQDKLIEIDKTEEIHILEAECDNEIVGYIIYSYSIDLLIIYDIEDYGDIYLCDGLIRTVFLKSITKKIVKAKIELKEDTKFSKLVDLKIVKIGNKHIQNVKKFIGNCKKSKEID